MKQVFLSYSTMDILETIELRDFLEENGVSCWMGKRDIQPGANYTVEITSAIDQCEIFVLILTENAQNSQYVISELECARAKKKQSFRTCCKSLQYVKVSNFIFVIANESMRMNIL